MTNESARVSQHAAFPSQAAPADIGAETQPARNRPRKAPNAFRTISEVADELHIPQHVLRFWETKFPQVRPLKRGGGRRYYRPDDIALLRRISDLLYIEGYTIKGVQRLLREGGGKLADDIPPPSAEERAGATEAGRREEPQLSISGLTAPLAASAAPPPTRPGAPAAAAARVAERGLAEENAALRRLLAGVLRSLEEMRRRLA
jgi:DNA-binding transcriptional MerR regulator